MIARQYWHDRITKAWERRSVVWLMGVRRAGKTTLARSLPDTDYFDCELPRARAQLDDPESFLAGRGSRPIVLDEIHRLPDPAELLKIAADHYPGVRVLATGSSTLGASARFRDTLAGRKAEVWLTPMIAADQADFTAATMAIPSDAARHRSGAVTDIRHRLLRGGLPELFLAPHLPEHDYQEWIDAYWAKDILELFRLERRHAFRRLFELILTHSGGMFEATRYARPCEVSRTTIANYLAVLEATFAVHVVRPYAEGGRAEITSAPRVYGFDTGFVCHQRGWTHLRPEDLGHLWEHVVLNEIHAHVGRECVRYWRTKHGNEVDFVVVLRGQPPMAIECKWSSSEFDPAGMRVFRGAYPGGRNLVVAADVAPGRSFERTAGSLTTRFVALEDVAAELRGISAETGS